ncbi:MAG: hypothetical protein E6J90_36755 [Deltaproteobacteria bacterium]|nr:MAG: hypothetical protein E6J90_36755 [Deltaproteobacteria bacterium]
MADPQLCEWFALCDREAVVLVAHPILGEVPTCRRCADRPEMADRAERPISSPGAEAIDEHRRKIENSSGPAFWGER